MADFKLCLSFTLPRLRLQDGLSGPIIRKLLEQLKSGTVSENELLQTLSSYSKDIILLLDGYDSLTEESKRVVKEFLQNPHPFSKSRIILSSRPGSGKGIVDAFDCCVEIRGIRESETAKVINVLRANKGKLNEQQSKCMHKEMSVLSYLPPYFVYFIIQLCKLNPPSKEKFYDLYSLLSIAVGIIPRHVPPDHFKKCPQSVHTSNESNFLQLGRFFFRALSIGYHTFEEELLKNQIDMKFEDLVRWNFIYPENDSSNESPTWSVSSKLIMVFFATKYLRHKWSKLSTDDDRERFVDRVLCGSVCTGDFIVGQGTNPCWYYVGLLPEIGLKLNAGDALENARFEMLYNVEDIHWSNAFDTVNLLLRVEKEHLHRFLFSERSQEDEDLSKKFGSVLNSLPVEDCVIDYRYYYNTHETKYFLKVEVSDSDERRLLNAVFRKNVKGITDRVHLDFSLQHLNDVICFVTAVLSSSLKGYVFEIEEFAVRSDMFITKIILALSNSQLNYPVVLTVTENKDRVLVGQQTNMTFEVFQDDKSKMNQVKYSILSNNTHHYRCITKKEFDTEIEKKVYDCLQRMENPEVTLQLL